MNHDDIQRLTNNFTDFIENGRADIPADLFKLAKYLDELALAYHFVGISLVPSGRPGFGA